MRGKSKSSRHRRKAGRGPQLRAIRRPDRPSDGWRVEEVHVSGRDAGPGMVVPSIDEVLAAMERLPTSLDWAAIAEQVIPVFPRVRPYASGFPTPLRTLVSPGVAVGFGIDAGPAFVNVLPEMLDSWAIDVADLTARALANLHARAATLAPSAIVRDSLDGALVELLQTGLFVGSTLVLAPGELARLFGEAPRLFITPMRDLIIGLPPTVDPELATWLYREFADLDPNCLGPTAYRFDGLRVTPASLDAGLLPATAVM